MSHVWSIALSKPFKFSELYTLVSCLQNGRHVGLVNNALQKYLTALKCVYYCLP